MNTHFKSLALAGMLALGGAFTATAATLDFTDPGSYSDMGTGSASGTFQGVVWTVTPDPAASILTYTDYDGDDAGALNPLASVIDGIGIGQGDDEVSAPIESITVTFSKQVLVSGVHFLDLFGFEAVDIYLDGMLSGQVGADYAGGDNSGGGYAYAFADEPIWVTVLRFVPAIGNDLPSGGFGNPDFALAAIDIAAVPLPAGGVLLLTALGGLGIAARRRKA